MVKRKILFIINPNSGLGKCNIVEKYIDAIIDKKRFTTQIIYTERQFHATEITLENKDNFDIIVAVGGDGTINEVSTGLIDSNTTMGIVPTGSGNGFARFFKIPTNPEKALQIINECKYKKIDTININDLKFVNVSGIGFDAHISHEFAKQEKRGALTYGRVIISEYPKYKPKTYKIVIDGEEIEKEAFVISFANTSQYGNNVIISPKARTDDGLIDVCFIYKFPMIVGPEMALRLFTGRIDRSRYDEIRQVPELTIKNSGIIKAHIDGEPCFFDSDIHIAINPLSLEIIVA